MTAPKWFNCSICGLMRLGIEPVHGDNPCPMKVEEHEAYMALLEQRKSTEAAEGFLNNDMVAMVEKITGRMFGRDDDD